MIATLAILVIVLIAGAGQLRPEFYVSTGVEIEVEGGFVLEHAEGIVVRATAPEMSIALTPDDMWTGEILVENINALNYSITGPDGMNVVHHSNNTLLLSLSIEDNSIITISPEECCGTNEGFTFYAMGDTHSYTAPLEAMLADAEIAGASFTLHLGDITSAGYPEQYDDILETTEGYSVPIFTTPGNHDARSPLSYYTDNIAPLNYYFEYQGYRFVSFYTQEDGMNEESWTWLEDVLSEDSSCGSGQCDAGLEGGTIVFTHIPAIDVAGINHSFLDPADGERFHQLMKDNEVDLVLSGHAHLYNDLTLDGVRYVTSGGGGGTLYASAAEGGVYHYTIVTVNGSGISVEPVQVPGPERRTDELTIKGPDEVKALDLAELEQMPLVTGDSSFENQYGNVKGEGYYLGVSLEDLVDLVGGLDADGYVRVVSSDGYYTDLGYANIYPDQNYSSLQGALVIAFSMDNETVPGWSKGMLLVATAPDGLFSIQDAIDTTPPEFDEPVSGGARWVRNVEYIEVHN